MPESNFGLLTLTLQWQIDDSRSECRDAKESLVVREEGGVSQVPPCQLSSTRNKKKE